MPSTRPRPTVPSFRWRLDYAGFFETVAWIRSQSRLGLGGACISSLSGLVISVLCLGVLLGDTEPNEGLPHCFERTQHNGRIGYALDIREARHNLEFVREAENRDLAVLHEHTAKFCNKAQAF